MQLRFVFLMQLNPENIRSFLNFVLPCFFQARLNEIITSETKTNHSSSKPEKPWMVDGCGVPPNASELLPKLVISDMFFPVSSYSYY